VAPRFLENLCTFVPACDEFKVECKQDSSATLDLCLQWMHLEVSGVGRTPERAFGKLAFCFSTKERRYDSVEQSHSWGVVVGHLVKKCSAFEESHHVHMIVLLDPIHSQMNLIYTTTFCLCNIHNLLNPWSRVLLQKLSGSQIVKNPPILWNPKVYNIPPPVPIVSEINAVHVPIPFLENPS